MTTSTSVSHPSEAHNDLVTYWVADRGLTPWLSFLGPGNKAIAFNVHVGAMLSNPDAFEVNVYGKSAGENVNSPDFSGPYHLEADNNLGTSWVGSDGYTLEQAQYLAQKVVDAFWDRNQPKYMEPAPQLIANQSVYSKMWKLIAQFVNSESVKVRKAS